MDAFQDPLQQPYNQRHLSLGELEERLHRSGDPLSSAKVLAAYEMAQSVHVNQIRNDGTPHLWHSTRTARIIMDEIHAFDADLLMATLLHDVLEDSTVITRGVIEYNFGSYVAYVVDVLTKDLAKARKEPDAVDIAHAERLRASSEDCLIIKLAARLDNMRCLTFNLKKNPLIYITNTLERYVPIAEATSNVRLHYLATAIRAEANTYLG